MKSQVCLLCFVVLNLAVAMEFIDHMDMDMETMDMAHMDMMETMDKMKDKMDSGKKVLAGPEAKCKKQGQFLKNPNGDQCSYMICVYGGESYDIGSHKPLLFTRPMPCAPGTYVPTDYQDTRPTRNPCVGMDTDACPAPVKTKEEKEKEMMEDEDEEELEDPTYSPPQPEVNNNQVQSNNPRINPVDARRAEMDRLYEEMKRMMEQMMAIRSRLESYESPNAAPEPRTFEASPGLYNPEPTSFLPETPVMPPQLNPESSFPSKVRLQQAGFALAGGNGIVTSLPRDEVNNIWNGVQNALAQPEAPTKTPSMSQGYPEVTPTFSSLVEESPSSIPPQMGYRPFLTKHNSKNPGNPRVVYLLPVRMPAKRNN